MSYHLLNIETLEYIYVDDQAWISALETAKEHYWQPGGTLFDLEYTLYDESEFIEDAMEIQFMFMQVRHYQQEWNGSYTEKMNQVLDYEDTYYMADSLAGTDTDPALIEFIKKGSFRICSE